MASLRQRKAQNGFTYIEVAIVVLIMGIVAAAAAPSFLSAIDNYRADLAAQRMKADLQYARSEARRTSRSLSVQFNTANHRYSLEGVSNIDLADQDFIVTLTEEPYVSTLVSVLFETAVNGVFRTNVVFDRFGRPDSPGTIVLQSGGAQRNLVVAADGRVEIP